jgi:hypothetical protein
MDVKNIHVNFIQLQKMAFLYNALEDGWKIRKKENYYVFTKNHGNKKEIYLDSYLKRFMVDNLDINKITIDDE